jgi:hypothetical protein
MARNTLAGSKNGNSESAKYFQTHPEARKKKNEYNTKYHATPERIKYRDGLNKANAQAGSKKGDGKDMSHTKSGKLVLESQKNNRARNGKSGASTKK